MHKINLLFVITKLELGGAQKQLLNLINHLEKDKFNIFLFAAKEGFLVSEASATKALTLKKSRWLERSINPFKDVLALNEIYRFIRKNKIQIVHTHSSKAGILGRWAANLAKAKLIIHTVHGWSFNDCQPFFMRLIFIWLERITSRFTHKLIVVSQYDKKKGLSNNIGNEEKYAIVRYGVDCLKPLKNSQEIKTKLGFYNGDLIVTMVSCFKPQKNPQDFIKFASLVNRGLSNVKFLLVGDGALRPEIEELIDRSNLRNKVFLTGWRRDIPEILSITDIFVLTSLWEGLPISVLEAMALSCPAVVTDTGGISEVVIDAKSGYLVQCRDMDKMSERALILLKDGALRKRMGESARERINFNIKGMVDKTQNLYLGLIGIN